ncbi:MAG: patatin-like phospholipase family protein [Firmicutes bacterium]|nr:patatin-like phospholipase family protein [Bacillota bacterium]
MNLHKQRIGLALSGGGIRAAIFHLGALQYFAEAGLFKQIANISSVSGASLAMGIILAVNGNKWPTEKEFLLTVQPAVCTLILKHNIQAAALRWLPFSPRYWRHRVGLLAKMLEDKWNIRGSIQDLPSYPYWEINCTTFETGNNFRIRRDYMGDSAIGYVQNPNLPISHMIAASAAFPVLIGPYILKAHDFRWTKDKHGKLPEVSVDYHYTLWDGGVYDNLGIDPLYTTGRGLDNEIDFLIVSNASAFTGHQLRQGNISLANLRRLLDISMNQVDVLRSRQIFSSIIQQGRGMYLKIGFAGDDRIRDYPTTLNSPTPQNFDLIFRHGYENAKYVNRLWRRRFS